MTQTGYHRIEQVYQWCSDAYLHNGLKLQFPKNTDRTKTYQWRYLTKLASQIDDWGFDDDTAKTFIDLAVSRCKRAGVLRKGLSVFCQKDMLQYCYDHLKKSQSKVNTRVQSLISTKHWFDRIVGDDCKILLKQPNYDSLHNITIWYEAFKINDEYLALSLSCGKALQALAKIDPQERKSMPTDSKLYLLRGKLYKEIGKKQLTEIFGKDLRCHQ